MGFIKKFPPSSYIGGNFYFNDSIYGYPFLIDISGLAPENYSRSCYHQNDALLWEKA